MFHVGQKVEFITDDKNYVCGDGFIGNYAFVTRIVMGNGFIDYLDVCVISGRYNGWRVSVFPDELRPC